MKIYVLKDNCAGAKFPAEHGLSYFTSIIKRYRGNDETDIGLGLTKEEITQTFNPVETKES